MEIEITIKVPLGAAIGQGISVSQGTVAAAADVVAGGDAAGPVADLPGEAVAPPSLAEFGIRPAAPRPETDMSPPPVGLTGLIGRGAEASSDPLAPPDMPMPDGASMTGDVPPPTLEEIEAAMAATAPKQRKTRRKKG